MTDTLLATLVTALLAGLGGLLVPRLIARVPEPAPRAEPEEPQEPQESEEPEQPEPPKMLYADIAVRPGLGRRSAVAAALVGGLIGWATGLDWSLLWLVPLVPVGVALSVIDWHTRLLPRIIVIPATLAAIVLVVVVGLATGERDALVRALVAMVVVRTFYWVLWSVLPGVGMGFGDVRLAAIVGLVLGWLGWGAVAIGVWVGMAVFGLPGLVLAIVRWDRTLLRKPFPFGPFMLVGAVVGLVWGTALAGRIWG
ncbi:prepilin peptidase [Nocardioides eburneiflavus]|uniref:Prepilin peptidase n=1 Tax=Nocardioides eburneiflavus TaxID=2518372 RepID=A0A4Z1CL19_9ACTN|nr:A24 family peptidase [Nocardioides eburneiflavus]TGN66003.1 prepilin peptidase [Nocardioides eburneiflavus]